MAKILVSVPKELVDKKNLSSYTWSDLIRKGLIYVNSGVGERADSVPVLEANICKLQNLVTKLCTDNDRLKDALVRVAKNG